MYKDRRALYHAILTLRAKKPSAKRISAAARELFTFFSSLCNVMQSAKKPLARFFTRAAVKFEPPAIYRCIHIVSLSLCSKSQRVAARESWDFLARDRQWFRRPRDRPSRDDVVHFHPLAGLCVVGRRFFGCCCSSCIKDKKLSLAAERRRVLVIGDRVRWRLGM